MELRSVNLFPKASSTKCSATTPVLAGNLAHTWRSHHDNDNNNDNDTDNTQCPTEACHSKHTHTHTKPHAHLPQHTLLKHRWAHELDATGFFRVWYKEGFFEWK